MNTDVDMLNSLAITVHPTSSNRRLLMVLQAYCDESHDEKSERVYVAAGLFAEHEAWGEFTKRWAGALKDSGLTVWHQSECTGAQGQGEYKGKSFEEREELQRKFINIILGTPLIGAVGGILLDEYNRLLPRLKKGRKIPSGLSVSGSLEDPYFLAFQLAIELVAKNAEARGIPKHETIAIIFDRTHLGGRASAMYDSLLNSKTLDFVIRLGTLTFADKSKLLPLQAADILAYEAFRYIDEAMRQGKPERWQWLELLKRLPNWHIFAEESLAKLVEQVGW